MQVESTGEEVGPDCSGSGSAYCSADLTVEVENETSDKSRQTREEGEREETYVTVRRTVVAIATSAKDANKGDASQRQAQQWPRKYTQTHPDV